MPPRFMLPAALALGAAVGCAAAEPVPPSVPGIHIVDDVARANPTGDAPVRAVEVQRGPRCSLHVVQVADQLPMHRHDLSDETVVIWRGAGVMQIGDDVREVRAGMVIHVPAGVPHAFRLTSAEPAVGVSIFTPALHADDRVPVDR